MQGSRSNVVATIGCTDKMEGTNNGALSRSPRPNPDYSPQPSLSPLPTPVRLWRPAAQKNLRNQWSKLFSYKDQWFSASSDGRASATELVNAILSQRYMPQMDLGVLKDMPDIRVKACQKLAMKQSLCRRKLLSSYKELVHVICDMTKASDSMRCYLKASANNSLIQFCNYSVHDNDTGDGGGVPVFSSWSIEVFEKLAAEIAGIFALETLLKRLIIVELLAEIHRQSSGKETDMLSWSSELYPAEFDDLDVCNMLSKESRKPLDPTIEGWGSDRCTICTSNTSPSSEVFQVYLTTWLSNLNINMHRLENIFSMVEDEMQTRLC